MDIFITGIIGLALGLSIGFILVARWEAEKHRLCHRRMRQTIEGLPGIMLGSESFGFAPAVKTPTAKAPEKKKRVSKPRTAAQKKKARDNMRIYRAKKKASQK